MLPNDALEQLHQPIQPLLLQHPVAAEIKQGVANGGPVDEGEGVQMGEHVGVRLG